MRDGHRLGVCLVIAATSLASSGCGGSSGGDDLTSTAEFVSPADPAGVVGTALSDPLVVRVLDSAAVPVEGLSVEFAVSSGDATLSTESVTTDADGLAQTTLTFGTLAGLVVVTASGAEIGQISLVVVASPTAPASLVIVSGDMQSGLAASPIGVADEDAFLPLGLWILTYDIHLYGLWGKLQPFGSIAFISHK